MALDRKNCDSQKENKKTRKEENRAPDKGGSPALTAYPSPGRDHTSRHAHLCGLDGAGGIGVICRAAHEHAASRVVNAETKTRLVGRTGERLLTSFAVKRPPFITSPTSVNAITSFRLVSSWVELIVDR
jgi:hypothetical protein